MNKQNRTCSVLVLGGYGAVGSAVCQALVAKHHCQVVVAGHDFEKARRYAQLLGQQATPLQVDVDNPKTFEDALPRASVVVNCVESNNFAIAKRCLQNAVHYVDVSASIGVIDQLQALDSTAKHAGATGVLSVGVAPGLTNLLVRHAQDRIGPLRRADIFLLLGLGEAHGSSAMQWTLSQFVPQRSGGNGPVIAFSEGRTTTMPKPFGRRTGYRFDFPDQHTLPATLGIENVKTWLCFDSRAITRIAWLLAKTGMLRALPIQQWSGILSKALPLIPFGDSQFAIQVDAVGKDEGQRSFSLMGKDEAQVTGHVAAHVAEHLLKSSALPGTQHLEQLMNLATLLEMLEDRLLIAENG